MTSGIRIRPAGLADARSVTTLLMRTFADEAITFWAWGWSKEDTSQREQEIQQAISIRHPGVKRMTTDPETYTFIASDSSKCQDTGFSAWCIPTPRNASHLLRSRTWSEYFYALLAHCYDTATAYIPNALYAYFCPQRARFIRQKQRWVTMDAEVTKTCMRKEDAENGYWKLAYLGVLPDYQGKGIASRLLQWGLDQADSENRAIYLQATKPAVGFYERHGFKVLARPEVVSSKEHGGPLEMIIMRRDCRSQRKKE